MFKHYDLLFKYMNPLSYQIMIFVSVLHPHNPLTFVATTNFLVNTDSGSALPRGFRAWRRLRVVKLNDFFSLIFSLRKQIYRVGVGVGGHPGGPRGRGARPHLRGQGVGPLVFIFGEDFLLFFLRCSVEFQVIPRTFIFYI